MILKARVTRVVLDEESLPVVHLFPYEPSQERTSTLQLAWDGAAEVPAVGTFVRVAIHSLREGEQP